MNIVAAQLLSRHRCAIADFLDRERRCYPRRRERIDFEHLYRLCEALDRRQRGFALGHGGASWPSPICASVPASVQIQAEGETVIARGVPQEWRLVTS